MIYYQQKEANDMASPTVDTLFPPPFLNIEVNVQKVCYTGSDLLTCFYWANTFGSACLYRINDQD